MAIDFDNTDKDIELLTTRISEALQLHAKFYQADESAPDYGFSMLAVAQDDEEGWVDVAVTSSNEDNSAADTRVYRVQIIDED